jgi:hypothetical protein
MIVSWVGHGAAGLLTQPEASSSRITAVPTARMPSIIINSVRLIIVRPLINYSNRLPIPKRLTTYAPVYFRIATAWPLVNAI